MEIWARVGVGDWVWVEIRVGLGVGVVVVFLVGVVCKVGARVVSWSVSVLESRWGSVWGRVQSRGVSWC